MDRITDSDSVDTGSIPVESAISSVPQVKIQETTIDLGPPAAFPWVYF